MALAGQWVTVDGSGQVWAGALPMVVPSSDDHPGLAQILRWAADLGETKFEAAPDAEELKALEASNG